MLLRQRARRARLQSEHTQTGGRMATFEMLSAAKEAELKENLWKIAQCEKAIEKVASRV